MVMIGEFMRINDEDFIELFFWTISYLVSNQHPHGKLVLKLARKILKSTYHLDVRLSLQ